MSSTSTANNVVNNFNGGQPTSNDFVPSIIFAVALVLTLPMLIYRLTSRKHRSKILGNAVMFFILRTASLILRAYMAKHSYNTDTLIAELVLTSISYLFLINSLIDLWEKHENQKYDEQVLNGPTHQKKSNMVRYIAWFLRGMLLAALATAIAAGVILRKEFNTDQQQMIIRNLVKASYILSLASTAVSVIGVLVTHFTNHRSKRNTAFLLAYSIPLLTVGIYRVVEVFTGYKAITRQLVAYWVAMVLFEFIALSILLAISIPKWFGNYVKHHTRQTDEEKNWEALNNRNSTSNSTSAPPSEMYQTRR